MDRFKKRYRLVFRSVHGKALGAGEKSVGERIPDTMDIVDTFAHK